MDQIDKMLEIADEILLNKQILLLIVTRGGNLLLSKELQKRMLAMSSTRFLFRCMCVKNKLITCDDIFKFSLRKKVETRVKSQKVEQPEESRPNRRCLEQITVLRRINKVWF